MLQLASALHGASHTDGPGPGSYSQEPPLQAAKGMAVSSEEGAEAMEAASAAGEERREGGEEEMEVEETARAQALAARPAACSAS